jgi:hypothetical protein
MKILLVILCAAPLFAQTLTLSGPATARPGTSIVVNLSQPAVSPTSAWQWQITPPTNYAVTVALGAAGSSSAKELACSADNLFCLVYGLNANAIPAGVLATYTVSIPATATAGPAPFGLSNAIAASPAGSVVPVTYGAVYSPTILALWDINGDGKTDRADVILMAQQVIAAQSNPAACVNDMNGDGKCTLMDVVIVILKTLGL